MAVPEWPADKGFVLADGWTDTWGKLTDRSENDAGPAKQRRITTSAPDRAQFQVYLTSDERDWLKGFYKGDAAGGAVWFNWTHPVTLAVVQARFISGEEPSYTPRRPAWVASITLEYRS